MIAGLALALAANPAAAQDVRVLRGSVTDAEGRPLGADVAVLGTGWSTRSDGRGRFSLSLPPGGWRVRIARIGFRPDTAHVTIGPEQATAELAVRLRVAPVALPGLTVQGDRTPALAQTVTTETIRQVPPVGEPDVFRAVVLLPAVSQPNDLKGRIHLAGGSSDETGVRLDGHPLQDPFHLLGLTGAINVAALQRADVRIHHLPASLDGSLSGIIDIETRRPDGDASREVVAGILSAGVTWTEPRLPGGADLLVSARVTYLDRLIEFLTPEATVAGDEIPLVGYRDALLRVGREWAGGWRAEAIGFHTSDFLRTTAAGERGVAPVSWGESMGGLRLSRTGPGWGGSLRVSANRGVVRLDPRGDSELFARTRRDWLSAAAELSRGTQALRATAGLAFDRRSNAHAWRTPGLAHEIFSPHTPAEYEGAESRDAYSAHTEVAGELGSGVEASGGVRVWHVAGRAHAAPRMLLAYAPSARLRLEAAADRRFQFDAELEEPIEGNITPPRFLLDEPRRADVVAASARWTPARLLGGAAEVQAVVFAKRYSDRPVLRDAPAGAEPDFPDFERVDARAEGGSLSLRWSRADDLLVQGAYTYQRSRDRLRDGWYPTSWDAPHDLSLLASTRALGSWHLNAVYRGHSGRATTPVAARIYVASEEFQNFLHARYLRGERNSVRVPPYHRLDLGARRSWEARGAEWTFFAQVLNVFFRANPVEYDWSQYYASQVDPTLSRYPRRGMPLLPSLGLEVRW